LPKYAGQKQPETSIRCQHFESILRTYSERLVWRSVIGAVRDKNLTHEMATEAHSRCFQSGIRARSTEREKKIGLPAMRPLQFFKDMRRSTESVAS
jgi:hypothetical protein